MKTKRSTSIIIFSVLIASLMFFSCRNNTGNEPRFPEEVRIDFEAMNLKDQLGTVLSIKGLLFSIGTEK